MNSSLNNSVLSLQSSLSILRSTNDNLGKGISDFERLKTVLQTNKVFDIVTETDVNEAKVDLAKEIEPQIVALMKQAEEELARLERKERMLANKAKLQQVRLQSVTNDSKASNKKKDNTSSSTPDLELADKLDKLKQLQQKKERLAYSLSRINLKKRKVRMSMAFGLTNNNNTNIDE